MHGAHPVLTVILKETTRRAIKRSTLSGLTGVPQRLWNSPTSVTAYVNTRGIVPMGAGAGAPLVNNLAHSKLNVTLHYSSSGVPFDFPSTHGADD